ncbi:lysine N(6)-hydroxylase/L-ornithine N(5)-oxygenase family protein [Roseateles sp. SL47]|uniref:lysine N(6)-hydroxylase/L-ornithine N(5)-oxygenase family protein n=1 Tax=Roseateles sp. SL47 TaxID=2995138 RepID=UPI0022718899|nr:lysine N(6)-hydroxylase/L-ornithine N(5)-oxygenase family protein [Roseateles sp. SL47]WAC71651.1 lysine N(6)-hydroxylase/L-ornithine N(5)-oxygenase family protein [Roseateles sp. SL47]
MQIHDLVGIGFGPSNIALAIALDEQRQSGRRLDALFIERQSSFAWHPGMLLDQTHMQISFIKDLATLRNPTSRFSFLNYLHEKQRLADFINLKTFYPSRHEFNDYLAWAAAQFDDRCAYGEDVVDVLPEYSGETVVALRVRSRDASGHLRERRARHLVVSPGGSANIPDVFKPLLSDARVFHSSRYRDAIGQFPQARRVAVLGAGQSAAEIFLDLQGRSPDLEVDLLMRARAIRPSDDSPFVNEIFNAEFVDDVYAASEAERNSMLREFWHTNYACPDLALIQDIYKVLYEQKVHGSTRLRLKRRHQVLAATAADDGIHLRLTDLQTGHSTAERYDAVVLATGYERSLHRQLLAPLAPWLGDCSVDRNYRVRSPSNFRPSIFLQGACENTHGLSDTLLSVTAVRTGEICDALIEAQRKPWPQPAQVC